MADYTTTFVNTLLVYGGSEANRWGSFTWGVDNWGTTQDLALSVAHLISNTLDMSSTVGKSVLHGYTNIFGISSTVGKKVSHGYTNEMSVTNSMTSIHLKNGEYYYRFPGGINFVGKVSTSFTLQTITTSAWSEATFTTTTWS